MNNPKQTRCGYVAIIGRPNVGKSTLLNHLLGQKISITSRKPQTTRHNILGILTEDNAQAIFIDTPGLHLATNKKALNRYLNRAATSAMVDVDIVLFVLDKLQWTAEDQRVADQIKATSGRIIVVINKIDQIQAKNQLLPHLQQLSERFPDAEIVPVSALQNDNLARLKTVIASLLPHAPFDYAEDQVTDRNVRFLCAEIIREKITRQLGDELPYASTVVIEKFAEKEATCFIDAVIWVERAGQKQIVVGEQGTRIKQIGQQARTDIEVLVAKKVMLTLWVKVKTGWSDDERTLHSLGYDDGQ